MESIGILIEKITPLYNQYKKKKNCLSGTDSLEIMWDIGKILKDFIEKYKIQPHTLYRQIYGKSEGSENIPQKSYITREFLGRCYRINGIFHNKADIWQDLPRLKSFTCFREAMPFFDNKKFKLEGKQKEELLNLLNSNLTPKQIISKLPKNMIGVKNPRTQKLHELSEEKETFIAFYNYIYELLKPSDYKVTMDNLGSINTDFIKTLARNTAAMAEDGLKYFDMKEECSLPELWRDFSKVIKKFSKQPDAKIIRRFRRLIPPERLVRLADMLYALSSYESYSYFINQNKKS